MADDNTLKGESFDRTPCGTIPPHAHRASPPYLVGDFPIMEDGAAASHLGDLREFEVRTTGTGTGTGTG